MAKVDQIRQKAAELFQKGDYAKAVAEYKKVLELEPSNAQIYNFVGDAYIKLNNIEEAIVHYREAMKYYSIDSLYNNAIAICRKIMRYRKDDVELYKTLGELYIHQGLTNEAITNLLEYAERMMREGRQDQAFPVYAQIVELNPQNLTARAKLAELYLSQKRTAEAINEFSHLAQAYRDQGRQIEAEALEARIRTLRGESASPAPAPPAMEIKPSVVLEELLQQKQEATVPQPAPASPIPQIVIEKEPSKPVEEPVAAKQDWATNIELGDLLVEIGSIQEALDQYHSAASGYLGDGNVEKAVEIYKKIAEIQPLELRSRQKLVEIALQSNQAEAIIEAYLGLAECLRRRELKEQAAAVYQKILEIDPVNEMALENLSLLLPELPEGSVEIPGMEVHAEPQFTTPTPPPEPAVSVSAPPLEAEPFSMPQSIPEVQPQPLTPEIPEWTQESTEEQSFIVQAEPAMPPSTELAALAGEPVSDAAKVHWGREIVEGGRQSRVKFSVADEPPQAPAAQEEFLSLSEILAEFKEGVFQQVGKEEYRQHYDLGISYKEMGLLEEAISEFQLASKGEKERLAAFEMLGLCFMERGEPKFAIKQFERGLATPGHSEEEYLGLYYYLGMAYEQLGDFDKAREAYENVYNVDVTFRDVGQKLLALGSGKEAAPEVKVIPVVEPEPAPVPPPQPSQPVISSPARPQPITPPKPTSPTMPQEMPRARPEAVTPAAPRPTPVTQRPIPVQQPPIAPKPMPAQPTAPYQPPITPAAQPAPARPIPAQPAMPRPTAAPLQQPTSQVPPGPHPAVRPTAPQPAPTAEPEPAPKPKPIPSKLKKPDKQRISYV